MKKEARRVLPARHHVSTELKNVGIPLIERHSEAEKLKNIGISLIERRFGGRETEKCWNISDRETFEGRESGVRVGGICVDWLLLFVM